jgi:pyruvate dehydrogenase E2 component (dihydrolipoamide acetyltransferase)
VAVNVTMPKWGLTMKQGKLSKWFKKEGDAIQKGEPLFEVETEKITNKVEAPASGTLFQIVIQQGAVVPVGTILAVIAEPGEQPERIEGMQMGEVVEGKAPRAETRAPAEPERPKKETFVLATPAARRLAKELGVDLTAVEGTGPGGRVTEADVTKYHDEGPPPPRITPLQGPGRAARSLKRTWHGPSVRKARSRKRKKQFGLFPLRGYGGRLQTTCTAAFRGRPS